MSVYTEVQHPFLAEFEDLGWDILDQGPGILSALPQILLVTVLFLSNVNSDYLI